MKITIVEDDYPHRAWLEEIFTNRFSDPVAAEINVIRTEHEFRENLKHFLKEPPNLFLIDVMLRWTDPAPNIPEPPPEVEKESFYRAGIRCVRLLLDHEETSTIPVILYTILEESDLELDLEELPPHIHQLQKTKEEEEIIGKARQVLGIN